MNDKRMETLAIYFAKYKHRNQVRKYTNEPYFVHCREVAHIIKGATGDIDVICAAYLHDTVEDTTATFEQIEALFNPRVRQLVYEVTDVSKSEGGNRATRKKFDREHIWNASPNGQLIKLADLISNTSSILQHDPSFAKVYLAEKGLLLEGMIRQEPLYTKALKIINTKEK